jgi:hypothetical protein
VATEPPRHIVEVNGGITHRILHGETNTTFGHAVCHFIFTRHKDVAENNNRRNGLIRYVDALTSIVTCLECLRGVRYG